MSEQVPSKELLDAVNAFLRTRHRVYGPEINRLARAAERAAREVHPDTALLDAFPGVRDELQHALKNRTALTKAGESP